MLFRQLLLLGISTLAISISATAALADIGGSENISPEPNVSVSRLAKAKSKKVSERQARAAARAKVTTEYASVPSYPAPVSKREARAAARAKASAAYASVPTSSSLVSEARRYIGTNPTNRRSLWCGAFMDMVLTRTGHRGGGNLARGYARYGTRVSGPEVGAIAVMTRGGGGGHVGVVSGVDEKGNVIVVSGNHNNTVAESIYPRGRIIAYVMPNAS